MNNVRIKGCFRRLNEERKKKKNCNKTIPNKQLNKIDLLNMLIDAKKLAKPKDKKINRRFK